MGTTTESPTTTVRLTQDATIALLKEARSQLDNGARELHCFADEGQRPTIAACVEIIGRLDGRPWGRPDSGVAEVKFSAPTIDWLGRALEYQRPHVADLDDGTTCAADPGYHAGEVFLLHVLEGVAEQAGRKAAA